MSSLNPEGDLFRGGVPAITPGIASDLRVLTQRMADLGFIESNIEKALQVWPLTYRRRHNILPYRSRLRAHGWLGTAIAFWLLQEWVSLEEARTTLGDHAVSVMHRLGWLQLGSQGLRSRVDLYPCCGFYFFTDTANSSFPWPEQVYWLGGDSYTLAYCTPRRPRVRALDLCTGSGIHAVLAQTHCQHSIGVDLNPRALAFGRLNAVLNNLPEVEFLPSDCYQAVAQHSFDLITLNPPFVPTPENIAELYRAGGASGESVTQRVVGGLSRFLREDGLFSMATEAPQRGAESPLQRLKIWLGESQGEWGSQAEGWGVAALYKHEFSLEEYILGHVLGSDIDCAERDREYQRWYDSYRAQGITSMVAAQFYAQRLPAGTPGWSCERKFPQPLGDQSLFLQSWMQAVQSWHGPWPEDFRPKMHDQVKGLFLSADAALIESVGTGWCAQPTRFGSEHASVLRSVQAGATLGEMKGAQPYAERILRELGGQLVIDCWSLPRPA